MPVHDWSKVVVGVFHDFHQSWIIEIRNSLNGGHLPEGFYAMAEQVANAPIQVLDQPEEEVYAAKADRIIIRDADECIVSIVEVMSPGNKGSGDAMSRTVTRLCSELENGHNLMIIDLHRPHGRDPQGLHARIFDHLSGKLFRAGVGDQTPFEVSSSRAGPEIKTFLHPIGLNSTLPTMPVFLTPELPRLTTKNYIHFLIPTHDVMLSLEETYMAAWNNLPMRWRDVIEGNS